MTHTPGPWKACTIPGDKRRWDVRDSKGQSITGWGRVTQTRENAHLIAAAPELLEALKALGVKPDGYCFCYVPIEGGHTGECRDAQQAIAKAEDKFEAK